MTKPGVSIIIHRLISLQSNSNAVMNIILVINATKKLQITKRRFGEKMREIQKQFYVVLAKQN